MRRIIVLFVAILLFGCTAPKPYSWQDTRLPVRDNAFFDLEECRTYTARQYRPGMPAGAPYLNEQVEAEVVEYGPGQWRPDRSPFPTMNINTRPTHDVPVDYTGYPGELDYHPSYLDDILEKCMLDRGWVFEKDPDALQ